MTQSCLTCLKYTICVVNFMCWLCGTIVLGLGIYMMINSKFSSLIPTIPFMNVANTLVIAGIIVTCISFLGFLGALKENRCLLISFFILLFFLMIVELAAACVLLVYEQQIDLFFKEDLMKSLMNTRTNYESGNDTIKGDWDTIQSTFLCCGVYNVSDWGPKIPPSCCENADCSGPQKHQMEGCYSKLKKWFEEHLLSTGAGVIVLCVIEVLGMCFSMTLVCHISQSGLGYK